MKDYNNSNPSWKEVRGHQLTAKETVGTIQNISKNIREYSLRMSPRVSSYRRESDREACPRIVTGPTSIDPGEAAGCRGSFPSGT